jgi:lysophospholipase L1-like esterase
MSERRQSLLFRLIASLLSLLAFLTVVEIIVRTTGIDTAFQNRFFVLNRALDYPDVFQKDRDLFWRFRPHQVISSKFFEGRTYCINSMGLRGEEVKSHKTIKRILALGNSCTFGWGIAYQDTYAEQLESLLNGAYEVINGGIPGYSSFQGRRFFEKKLINLQLDIVLILFAWNDHWAAANQIADKDQQFPPRAVIGVQNFLSHLHLYRLMKKLLLTGIEKEADSLFDRTAPVYRVGLKDFQSNLREICRVARSKGITPILLTSPIPSLATYYPPGSKSPLHSFHEKYNQAIRELSVSDTVDLVDLAREFDCYGDLFDDAPNDPIHFNTRGHRVAAELLAEYMREHYFSGPDAF